MTRPLDNASQRAVHTLAGRIAAAVAKDEQGDGCDISAGLFGTAFSDLIRSLAQEQLEREHYEVLLREFDAYSAHDKDYVNSPFQRRINGALSKLDDNDPVGS